MSIETQVKRVTEASKNTLKTLLIKMGVTVGDESIDQYPTLAATAVAISDKQNKLSGSSGQIVGFNSSGEAVAQDANYAPSSHVSDGVKHITASERSTWNAKQNAISGTAGQIVGFDANGKPVAQDMDFDSSSVIEQNKGLKQKFWRGTQAEYDAITTKADDTMYIIVDGDGTVAQSVPLDSGSTVSFSFGCDSNGVYIVTPDE